MPTATIDTSRGPRPAGSFLGVGAMSCAVPAMAKLESAATTTKIYMLTLGMVVNTVVLSLVHISANLDETGSKGMNSALFTDV